MTAPETIAQTDEELLRLMLAGEESAFVTLYRRWQSGIYRFALRMSGSEALAEDVTQEVFLALMRDASRFEAARGAFGAYLYGIARHHVLRRLERERPYVPIADETTRPDGCVPHEGLILQVDPLGDLSRNEKVQAVRSAILSLPPHYREVVVLCELHEMSYAEAAAVLGCALGTVRSRLHRARALLVERLREINESQLEARRVRSARRVL